MNKKNAASVSVFLLEGEHKVKDRLRNKTTMLKQACLLFAVMMVCLFTVACSGKDEGKETAEKINKRAFYLNGNIMVTEEFALYDFDNYLRYFDSKSKAGIVFCFDPSCEHLPAEFDYATGEVIERCPAYCMSDGAVTLRDDGVFFVREQVSPCLMQADREGKNRKVITKATEPLGYPIAQLFSDKDYYVAFINTDIFVKQEAEDGTVTWLARGTRDNNEAGIYRMSLDGKLQAMVFRNAENHDGRVNNLYEYNNHLYFCYQYLDVPFDALTPATDSYPRYLEDLREHSFYEVYDYDIKQECLTCVLKDSGKLSTYRFCDGYIIQCNSMEGPSVLFRMNGERLRELEGIVNNAPLCDGDVILQCFEDGQTVYRLYNPLNNSVSREIRSVKDSVLLLAAIGESYYVSLQDDNGAKTAYIGKEDFWNGAFERAVVLPTEHAN